MCNPGGWLLSKSEDQPTKFINGSIYAIDQLVKGTFEPGPNPEGKTLQREANREEVLDHGVMNIAGDSLTLIHQSQLAKACLEPGIRNCGTGHGCHRLDHVGIIAGEAPWFLGEIEVAENGSTNPHGYTEKRVHRRVMGWKSDTVRMFGNVVDHDRAGFFDDGPKQPVPAGKVTDCLDRFLIDALVDELN
jgi:hypothetical protein